MKARIAVVAAIFLLLALSTGCDKIEDAVQPEPTVVTQEATVAVAAAPVVGELPDGMADDIPLWPGSTVAAGKVADSTVIITLETTSTYADVVAGTTVGFERAGWTVAKAGEEASATVLNVAGEGYEGVLTLTDVDGIVALDYLLTQDGN